jgi:hypothetical protein
LETVRVVCSDNQLDRSAEYFRNFETTSCCGKSAVERCRNRPRVVPTKYKMVGCRETPHTIRLIIETEHCAYWSREAAWCSGGDCRLISSPVGGAGAANPKALGADECPVSVPSI